MENFFLYKQGQQERESLLIRIINLVIIQTCGHLLKIYSKKQISIEEARKQQDDVKNRLQSWMIGLIPMILEKD